MSVASLTRQGSMQQPLLNDSTDSSRRAVSEQPELYPPPHGRYRLARPKAIHDLAVPAATNPLAAEHGDFAHQRDQGKLWTPDRGAGFYQTERERYHKPALVSTGK